jgi:UDP-N-acetylglucosamine 2-epimerase (non-hydrolysing)
MSRTVLSVVGARPQFVKAFPVSRALSGRETLVHTGQHYDAELSDVFFEELDITPPSYNLGVGSGSHADQTAAVMRRLDSVLDDEDPDTVLVYGDTNSTLGAALVAAKRDVTLAHVEAGVRSDNWEMPEEVNRVLTDRCSDYRFAPSERAVGNLAREGITEGVHCTGDVMYDALLAVKDRVRDREPPDGFDHASGEYILATVHRAGNTDDRGRLANIVDALADAPRPVALPAHPRTVAALEEFDLLARARARLDVMDPVGYLDFLGLVEGAERVATDSGGVQKEAVYLGTPCVTLREETEWVETVEAGWNVLVGADPEAIRRELRRPFRRESPPSLYGDGDAATRIADLLAAGGA